jgi:STE24 endopeptidase
MRAISRLRHPGPWRIGAAAVAAVVVAEAAVWLLRPRPAVVHPVKVPERSYFSAEQIDRASDFRDGQRLLFFCGLAIEGGVLVALALARPAPLRRALDRAGRRPVLGGAAVGGAISLTLAVTGLPVSAIAQQRAVDVGLSTQSFGAWLTDVAKSTAIAAVLAAAGAAIAVTAMRRLGSRWWIGGAGLIVVFAVLFSWLAPVLLAPIFNRFERLPPGPVRSDVLALGKRAGVDIGQVYRVDASRRSTGLNAYVDGIGPTKRVVLYDNLLDGAPRAQIRSVVAHELGHVKGRDVLRGIAWVALVAPLGALFVAVSTEALGRRTGDRPGTPGSLPALALSLALASLVLGLVSNQLSRRVEARADTFALELTHDPKALISVQRRLATTNVAEPAPPAALVFLFGTHPTTMERIGAAVGWERGERP